MKIQVDRHLLTNQLFGMPSGMHALSVLATQVKSWMPMDSSMDLTSSGSICRKLGYHHCILTVDAKFEKYQSPKHLLSWMLCAEKQNDLSCEGLAYLANQTD